MKYKNISVFTTFVVQFHFISLEFTFYSMVNWQFVFLTNTSRMFKELLETKNLEL